MMGRLAMLPKTLESNGLPDDTEVIKKMKSGLRFSNAFFTLCLGISVTTIISLYILTGMPLVLHLVITFSLNIGMLLADFYYLYKSIKSVNKPLPFDLGVYALIGAITVVATVTGVIFTRDLGLQIMQGALGFLMLSGQAYIVKTALNKSEDDKNDGSVRGSAAAAIGPVHVGGL